MWREVRAVLLLSRVLRIRLAPLTPARSPPPCLLQGDAFRQKYPNAPIGRIPDDAAAELTSPLQGLSVSALPSSPGSSTGASPNVSPNPMRCAPIPPAHAAGGAVSAGDERL